MHSLSVIVTTCNNGAVLPNALRSVEEAVAFLPDSPIPAGASDARGVPPSRPRRGKGRRCQTEVAAGQSRQFAKATG
jgi:hypothetical protein